MKSRRTLFAALALAPAACSSGRTSSTARRGDECGGSADCGALPAATPTMIGVKQQQLCKLPTGKTVMVLMCAAPVYQAYNKGFVRIASLRRRPER
jgi:hypothetical protein